MILFQRTMSHWFDQKAVDTFSYLLGYFTLYAMLYICFMWLSEHYKSKELPHA
jgi:hypothetical protein